MPKKPKATPDRVVLVIERTGRTSKSYAWMPQRVYPNVSIHRAHGWVNLDGWSIEPGKANAFPFRYLPDVIKEWQQQYGKAWKFRRRNWVKGEAGEVSFPIR